MARRVRRLVPREFEVTNEDTGVVIRDHDWKLVEEWEPEPPTEAWSEWMLIEVVEDKYPTYYAKHNHDGGLFRSPTLNSLSPRVNHTCIYERKLIRRWVDPNDGPMAEVVDREVRYERAD